MYNQKNKQAMTIYFTQKNGFELPSLSNEQQTTLGSLKHKAQSTKLIAVILFSFFAFFASAQSIITPKQYISKAEEVAAKGDYNSALEYYRIVIGDNPERYDIYMNAIDAAVQTHHYRLANDFMEKLVKSGNPKDYPLLSYKRGLIKENLEEYDLATSSFEKYLADYPTGEAAPLAHKEIANCAWAKTIVEGEKKYEIIHLDSKVNSIYVDAAPIQYGDNLYYTSGFFPDSSKAPVTHIFSKNLLNNEPGAPININSRLPTEHTAHFTLSSSGQMAYYNICNQNEDGSFLCAIYSRPKIGDNWGLPVKLDSLVNKPGYTSTQPTVGFDSVLNSEVIFFSSNRPGGKGGLDIWRSAISANGKISAPENVADINTSKDELTPFFFAPAQVLFFSTNGDKTLGGYDVYISNEQLAMSNEPATDNSSKLKAQSSKLSSWSTPEHMGYPLNSSYDDLYYSVGNGKAFFSSNRPGGLCGNKEKDCVCNDIYSYDLLANLKAEALMAGTGEKLRGTTFYLTDLSTGIRTLVKLNVTDASGFDSLALDFGKSYRLSASKEGFLPDSVEFNTKNLYKNTNIAETLSLRPKARIITYVFDRIDRKPISGGTITIKDGVGKILIRTVMSGNTYTYSNVNYGSAYYISVEKDKLEPDSAIVTIADLGKSTKTEYVDSLYLGSFSGLPLTLYFDNDEPNPRTRQATTDLTYGQTFASYYNKQQEYLTNYYTDSKGATNSVSMSGANEISDFFQNKIKANYDKLEGFCGLLYNYLSSGHGLEMKIQGYASPLAPFDYNQILSARRISSVINHFQQYHGGILMDYVKNGHLRIQLEPEGAVNVTGVSSDPKDRRNSVYSVPAMQERRVQILEINRMDLPIGDATGKRILRGLYAFNEKGIRMGSGLSAGVIKYAKKGKRKSGNDNSVNLNSQEMEVVLMDSYTNAAISNSPTIELYDALTNKLVGKARKKGNKYIYSVVGGTDYLVKAGGSGYSSKSYNTVLYNYWEGNSVVDTMYLTPFGGLPTTLYFDNNRPGNSDSYDQSFRDFYSRKGEFIKMYNRLPSDLGVDTKISQEEMRLFFDAEVKSGYQNLVGFSGLMKSYLQKGYNLEVVLEGYASSLSNAEYNKNLAERRTQCVINYLYMINGGVFKKYLKNGKLKINTETIGSATSTAPNDAKNPASIYGLEASHDRKVVIKDIIIR